MSSHPHASRPADPLVEYAHRVSNAHDRLERIRRNAEATAKSLGGAARALRSMAAARNETYLPARRDTHGQSEERPA